MAAGSRHRRAQGQVNGVRLQNDGILNGCHIVRVIGAAASAENLHGNDLRIRCDSLGFNRLQRRGKGAISIGNIGVGRRNALHMGTVLPLMIMIMRNVQVLVHIVKGKSNLGAYIQLLGRIAQTGNVQLAQLLTDFIRIQQVRLSVLLLQSVLKGSGVKALMVRINARINHGYPAACAGISGGPGMMRANHVSRSSHIGTIRLFPIHNTWSITGFQNHVPNTS